MSESEKMILSKEEMEEIFGVDPTAPATQQQELQAYCYLGMLATTFSEIEKNLRALIGTMEGLGFTGYKLIDDNSMGKNLHLLESINKWKKFKEEEVTAFIAEIRKNKADRNNLIHGKWQIFQNSELQPVVAVRDYRTKISKNRKGQQTLGSGEQRVYTFSELTALIDRTRKLNEDLKDILVAQMAKDHPGAETWMRKLL